MTLRHSTVMAAAEGTNEWIWTHQEYQDWENQQSGILWIQGKPGSGKSVLAKTIYAKLARESPDLVCSWFYSRQFGQKTITHDSLLRAFLQQMLSCEPKLFGHYEDVYRNLPPEGWSAGAMKAVLVGIANSGKKMICIIDAMDESASGEGKWSRYDILNFLEQLAFQSPTSCAKIIVLSRPIDEDQYFQDESCYRIILQDSNRSDIIRVIEIGVESIHHVLHPPRREGKRVSLADAGAQEETAWKGQSSYAAVLSHSC